MRPQPFCSLSEERRQHTDISDFLGHDARYPRSQHLLLVVDEHSSVVIEANVSTVRSPRLFLGPHDHSMPHIALPDLLCQSSRRVALCRRSGLLDDDHDEMSLMGVRGGEGKGGSCGGRE